MWPGPPMPGTMLDPVSERSSCRGPKEPQALREHPVSHVSTSLWAPWAASSPHPLARPGPLCCAQWAQGPKICLGPPHPTPVCQRPHQQRPPLEKRPLGGRGGVAVATDVSLKYLWPLESATERPGLSFVSAPAGSGLRALRLEVPRPGSPSRTKELLCVQQARPCAATHVTVAPSSGVSLKTHQHRLKWERVSDYETLNTAQSGAGPQRCRGGVWQTKRTGQHAPLRPALKQPGRLVCPHSGCEEQCGPNLFSQTCHAQITAYFQLKGVILLQKQRSAHSERLKGLLGYGELFSPPCKMSGALMDNLKTGKRVLGEAVRRGLLSVTFPCGCFSEKLSLHKTLFRLAFRKPPKSGLMRFY